ncbi:MAG: Diaminopimelate epimerase [Firmicutes bacterium]|nr:Diaminopimelate epimerase [Bacillota bacterium]
MQFTKMHGLGNDFIVVDMFEDQQIADLRALAQVICQRHFGVGADGLVLVHPSQNADCRMQIFNADGSEAESCGNALRCVARFMQLKGRVDGTRIKIEAPAGMYDAEIVSLASGEQLIKVDMGAPLLAPAAIPALFAAEGPVVDLALSTPYGDFRGVLVNSGVPHVVIFVPDLAAIDFVSAGQAIEKHPLFPHGINVDFVHVHSRDHLKVKVWERGAGATLACGTGAAAVVVAAHLTGRSDRRLTVALPGGELFMEWAEESGHVFMTGPAVVAFTGQWSVGEE